ncbi:MAG: phosphate acyltransferase PlsX [Alphaproteobacteria bacterium]|nr:phosphate acyltransferase PlsX [Alphaproteobacteria bacterium]
MTEKVVIALDAMGGDAAPDMVVGGAALARRKLPHVHFLLFGDSVRLKALLAKHPVLADCVEIRHTDQVVKGDDKPSTALRGARESSMRKAIDAVKEGDAAAAVSAGNTGALMAMSKFVLKTIKGIDRPAIITAVPTAKGSCCILDLGANVQCSAENLVQFAVMGEVFARTVLSVEKPTIGLINIGIEEIKGNEAVKEAAGILRETTLPIEFAGFIEGNDIAAGTVDVAVTDGFTGNVALKVAEGTAKLISGFLRESFRSSWRARMGYLLARPALALMRTRVDPRSYNGAIMCGLNGIVVKSHGNTDAFGFSNAIAVAVDMATHGFIEKMREDFERLRADYPANDPEPVS